MFPLATRVRLSSTSSSKNIDRRLGAMLVDSVSSWAALSAGAFVAWYVVTAFISWYRFRHIPGPFLGRITFAWHMSRMALNGHGGPLYENLHKIYADGGPFVMIAPNYVVTNDPDVWRRVSALRSPYARDDWWLAGRFHPDYENLACIVDTERHDAMKAKTSSGYSGRETGAQFETAIDEQVGAITDLIRRKYLSTADNIRPTEIAVLMRYFTLDVITRLGYGKPFGHLNNGEDVVGYVQVIDQMLQFMGLLLDVPPFRRIVFSPMILRLVGPKETDKVGPGRVQGVIHKIVSERFAEREKNKDKTWNDMVGGFMRNGLTQQEIEGEANLQILAGSDTTSTVLTSAIMYLTTTPHAYVALKRIIRDAVASGVVSHDKPITFQAALELPYLQAIIYEAMRIRFPVNYGHYKNVPPGGDTINGVFLPGGTAVGHNALGITRNEKVFGKDTHLFRPERFLAPECDAELKAYRVRSIDILFGGGRWTCSGKQVAMYELNKLIFEVSLFPAKNEVLNGMCLSS
ncbi:Pisatin demethylase [Podospora aff. communis PSN243]|uniref:Pisatin demethylase n=1 Tax=Podospora aff. communis PSN243 TaxID=3040156 RepID=A0AAV9GPV9_9PEZI|nr:Pisatin demethylase [Podospora aff. communis PSN243]